jgi:hypothetical protein
MFLARADAWLVALAVMVGCAGALSLAVGLPACGGGSDLPAPAPVDAGAVDAGTLHFEAPDVLTAMPATTAAIVLDADTQGAITLALDGDYADGSLASGTVTPVNGTANVVVRTPSTATTFRIHARSESGATADLTIAVGAAGFTSLGIHPTYSGVRTSGTVVASAFIDTSCALLGSTPLNDGAISASGSVGTELVLEDVPAGVNVAIYARIGHYAAGCIDAGALSTGQAQELDLPIYDLPMALSATNLEVTLAPAADAGSPEQAYWTSVQQRGRDRAVAAFTSGESDEDALLDAMVAQVPATSQAAFTASRTSEGWNTTTATWLSAHLPTLVVPASTLHEQVYSVLDAAIPRTLGPVVFGLAQAGGGMAQVSPETVDGVVASAAGWLAPGQFQWTADAHDNVQLQGPFLVQTSATLTALATTSGGSSDVPGALAATSTGIDCDGLAAMLTSSSDSYPGCDAPCTSALCSGALGAMWIRAGGASQAASDITQVSLVASGPATVGDAAQPVSFAGNWVSQISAPSIGNGELDGTVTAVAK